MFLSRHDVAEPTEGLYYKKNDYSTSVRDILGDDWRKEWDAFHDARAEPASPAIIL